MKISTIRYSLVDGLKGIKRNRTLSAASMATVAATLFILGIFMLIVANINRGIKGVESKLEVQVFLKKDVTTIQRNDIDRAIKDVDGVKSSEYETKAQALSNLKSQLGPKNDDILSGLDKANPLPESFIVKVDKPEIISKVVSKIKDMPGIDEIEDEREIVNKIIAITKTIKWVGIILFGILIVVSVFLISNTIKITVYSRRKEINIMKYIGATDWFIRIPFVIEGMIIGIIGAIVSNVLLYYAYSYVNRKMTVSFAFIKLVDPSYVLGGTLIYFLLAGIIIGAAGSIMAVRKFLAV